MKKDEKIVDGKVYDNETETWNEPKEGFDGREEIEPTEPDQYQGPDQTPPLDAVTDGEVELAQQELQDEVSVVDGATEIELTEEEASEFIKNQKMSSYKLEWWLADSDNKGGVPENSINQYFNPMNINNMNYDDLNALPNLTPIDVKAVLLQKKRGYINGTFELKNSPGISYYGYKNVLDFIVFEDQADKKVDVRYSVMARNIPSYSGLNEEDIPIDFIDTGRPENLTKLLIGYDKMKFGLLKHSNLGDPTDVDNNKGFIAFEKIGLSDSNPWFRIDNIIIGNFNARFGQGVIFESGDSFQPRRTGHGFSKRETGITYDLTRSSQFVLSGYAMQLSSRKMRFSIFYFDTFELNI